MALIQSLWVRRVKLRPVMTITKKKPAIARPVISFPIIEYRVDKIAVTLPAAK